MTYLHKYNASVNPTDCLFGMKFAGSTFFADDGFGNYITFGNDTLLQLFASTNDILSLTCAEREHEEAELPNIIE